jgi:predicted transcriptional regulator
MTAYISLDYSSDGPSPSEIDEIMEEQGLRRHGTYYFAEDMSDEELRSALDRIHRALKGSGVRYHVSQDRPDQDLPVGKARAEVLRLVDAGLVEESALDLLGRDVQAFRREALRTMQAEVERVISLCSNRGPQEGERTRREGSMESISSFLRSSGGCTFQEVQAACRMDDELLASVLEEMIEQGRVTTHHQGRSMIYHPAGPILRSLCR